MSVSNNSRGRALEPIAPLAHLLNFVFLEIYSVFNCLELHEYYLWFTQT